VLEINAGQRSNLLLLLTTPSRYLSVLDSFHWYQA